MPKKTHTQHWCQQNTNKMRTHSRILCKLHAFGQPFTLCGSVRRAWGAKNDRLFTPSAPKASNEREIQPQNDDCAQISCTQSVSAAIFCSNCTRTKRRKIHRFFAHLLPPYIIRRGKNYFSKAASQLCASVRLNRGLIGRRSTATRTSCGPSAMTQHQTPPPPRVLLLSARCRKWKSELYAPKAYTPADAIRAHFFFKITQPEQNISSPFNWVFLFKWLKLASKIGIFTDKEAISCFWAIRYTYLLSGCIFWPLWPP
jgi:hypothetical protein